MRRVFLILSLLAVVALGGAVGTWQWLKADYQVDGPLAVPATVIIHKGARTIEIASRLKQAGVILDAKRFGWGLRLFADPKPLRAGEFAFKPAMSAAQVIAHLQTGKTVIRKVTIAEGLSNLEIADTLAKTPGLTGLLEPIPTEGRLLPETYHFSYGDSRAGLVKRMRQAMTRLLTEAWPNRGRDLPLKTPAEALVLASIVEKETGVASERRRVAGVFINRLRIGMRLQSDPTVIFGITKGREPLGRSITKSDLRTETAYNTYVIKGLPPGPITNPGRAAILAVLNPADTKELYFVATGFGGHAFARTLREHNRNVAQWRKIERARKKAN